MPINSTSASNSEIAPVTFFQKKGAKDDIWNNWEAIQLHLVVKIGDIQWVKKLLDQGVNVNTAVTSTDLKSWTPLHTACAMEHVEIILLLLLYSADYNAKNENGVTALHISVQKQNATITEYLLDQEADPNITPYAGKFRSQTSLHVAYTLRNNKIINLLLKHGADINARNEEGKTILFLATEEGDVQMVEYLLHCGAYTMSTCFKGQYKSLTPLHMAALKNNVKIIEILMEYEPNVDARDQDGKTALYIAAEKGHFDVVRCLIEHRANVNRPLIAKDLKGWIPLHAASVGNFVDIVYILLAHGAKIDGSNACGQTALYLAAEKGNLMVADCLLRYGAKSDLQMFKNQYGWAPLHIATKNRHMDVVECLLEYGASVDIMTHRGMTPLHIAIEEGSQEIVEILLRNGADVDMSALWVDFEGWSPLHFACKLGRENIVRKLVKFRAKVDVKDYLGRTPIDIAINEEYRDIVDILLRHAYCS